MSDEGSREVPSAVPDAADVLLHVCCAPCATYPVPTLRAAGYRLLGLWYNPNIHPWSEHEARRRSLIDYARRVELPVVWHQGFDMVPFLRIVAGAVDRPDRCRVCYEMRMRATAAEAARRGIPAFTTTLLVSPFQDRALIYAVGQAAADAEGVTFLAEDFRKGWGERSRLTREYGLYRQQYCGCIYSEFERYAKRDIAEAAIVTYEDV
ncbi:MAG: epoxyqueuosine reductase QueH [Anaerolineae bacterium]